MNSFLRKRAISIAILAIIILLLPIIIRHIHFYRGILNRWSREIVIPAYSDLELERPELSLLPQPNKESTNSKTEVLFDVSHGNIFALSELETLTDYIIHNGGQLNVTDYYGSLDDQLKKADAFVVIAPAISFEESERKAVARFVERGGRLLVIADPTRVYLGDFFIMEDMGIMSNVDICNLLLEPYGISYSKAYVYNLIKNEGNFRNVYFNIIDKSPISADLEEVVFYGLHTIKTAPHPFIIGDENTLSSLTDRSSGLVAAASDAEGRVLALTDMNFMLPPYHRVADNGILTKNIAEFLSGSARERSLADFPYIFSRPVTLLIDAENALDTEMLATITGAQHSMEELGLELNISNKPDFGHDLVAFGTFPPDENLEPLLEPFDLIFAGFEEEMDAKGEEETVANEVLGIEFPTTPAELLALDGAEIEAVMELMDEADAQALMASLNEEEFDLLIEKMEETAEGEYGEDEENGPTVDVPGFGKVESNGIGLILYHDTGEQNSVILLADSTDNLEMLASSFYNGSIENCAIQGQIAVCVLDEFSSSDSFWEDDYEDSYDDYYEPDYSDGYEDAAG